MDLSRAEMMLGKEDLKKIQNAKIAVIGLGGVGSYVVEALARSGVNFLRLIDGDVVSSSNINRQLPALTSTINKRKTDVVQNRILDINPDCKIETLSEFYKPGDFNKFFPEEYTYIVDAIDQVDAKIDLLTNCVTRNIKVISSMGTGNKLDPTKLEVCDISKTHGCPLARTVRGLLRKEGITSGVETVFSSEEGRKEAEGRTPSSMVFVPASAGLLIASVIVRKIIEK